MGILLNVDDDIIGENVDNDLLMMMAMRTRMTMWWDGDAHSCSPQGGQVAQLNPEHQFPFSTSSSASLTNIAHGNVRSPLLWCAFVL